MCGRHRMLDRGVTRLSHAPRYTTRFPMNTSPVVCRILTWQWLVSAILVLSGASSQRDSTELPSLSSTMKHVRNGDAFLALGPILHVFESSILSLPAFPSKMK